MRKDQIERLNDLSERVCEVFITEADPGNWTGAGLPLDALDQKTRGDRVWDKKNAIQTGALLARIIDLRERPERSGPEMPEDDAERDIKRFEKAAKEMIEAVASGSRTG